MFGWINVIIDRVNPGIISKMTPRILNLVLCSKQIYHPTEESHCKFLGYRLSQSGYAEGYLAARQLDPIGWSGKPA